MDSLIRWYHHHNMKPESQMMRKKKKLHSSNGQSFSLEREKGVLWGMFSPAEKWFHNVLSLTQCWIGHNMMGLCKNVSDNSLSSLWKKKGYDSRFRKEMKLWMWVRVAKNHPLEKKWESGHSWCLMLFWKGKDTLGERGRVILPLCLACDMYL